jgi:hypothetical protein
MTADIPNPKIRIAMIAVGLLMLSGLYLNLYDKFSIASGCSFGLARLQLIDMQLDTTEAALNAAAARRYSAKR